MCFDIEGLAAITKNVKGEDKDEGGFRIKEIKPEAPGVEDM